MAQEVQALGRLVGSGIPRLIDHNMQALHRTETELYFVMEWMYGKTLSDGINSRQTLSVDDSLTVMVNLLGILDECHGAGVIHRDIKPNNVMLDMDTLGLVLVDFGTAYLEFGDFERDLTGQSQELGNRFLRLPEFAPGGRQRDSRSDVTLSVGILYFLLTGTAPRFLINDRMQPPHEVELDAFPAAVLRDSRWNELKSIFDVGFQIDIAQRWQSAKQLAQRLAQARELPTKAEPEPTGAALSAYQSLVQTAKWRAWVQRRESLYDVSFSAELGLENLARRINLQTIHLAGRSAWDDEGRMHFHISLCQPGQRHPSIGLDHYLAFTGPDQNRVEASFAIDGKIERLYYEGPAADTDGLLRKANTQVEVLFERMLEELTEDLEALSS